MNRHTHKEPSFSEICKTEVVCPNDTNPMSILQGGRLVEWMDIAAAVCAQTHAGQICVTASIQHVDFHSSAKIGDIVTIKARITRAFNTSMEIFVQAFARKVVAGKDYLICEAYFTFVAIDENGKSVQVMAVKPVSTKEQERYDAAFHRRKKKTTLQINNNLLEE